MTEKNPFDDVLDQLNQLLQLVQDCSNKTPDPEKVPINIEKQLNKLEQDVETFKRMGDDLIAMSGVSKVELQKRIDGAAEDISPENKDLINKASQLLSKAESIEKSYLTGVAEPIKAPPEKEVDDAQFRKRRRRKFKGFGGEEGRKPL